MTSTLLGSQAVSNAASTYFRAPQRRRVSTPSRSPASAGSTRGVSSIPVWSTSTPTDQILHRADITSACTSRQERAPRRGTLITAGAVIEQHLPHRLMTRANGRRQGIHTSTLANMGVGQGNLSILWWWFVKLQRAHGAKRCLQTMGYQNGSSLGLSSIISESQIESSVARLSKDHVIPRVDWRQLHHWSTSRLLL